MPKKKSITGRTRQFDTPVWGPLEAVVGELLAGWFMWMAEIELADGTRVQAYKHVATRRYLHLAADGRAFAHRGTGRYVEAVRRDVIDEVFEDWELIAPVPDDMDAVRAAIAVARAR